MQLRNQATAGTRVSCAANASTLVLPVVVDALLQVVVDVFIDVHVGTRPERGVTRHVLEIVCVGYRIIDDGWSDTRRILEIKRIVAVRRQRVDVGLRQCRRVGVGRTHRVRQHHPHGQSHLHLRPIRGKQIQMPESDNEKCK